MEERLDPKKVRRERNDKMKSLLGELWQIGRGKPNTYFPYNSGGEEEDAEVFQELVKNDFVKPTIPTSGESAKYLLTEKGRDEVEREFPTLSEAASIQIDEEIFIRSFTNLEDYHIRTLEDLRNFEKTFKGMELRMRGLKEQLTDISLKMDESELRKEIDSLHNALDPTHITSSFVHLYRLWQSPKSEPLRKFLAEKIPQLENTMESMPVKGLK